MALLHDRDIVVTIDTLRLRNLRMSFRVNQTREPEPNKTEISIFNLSADSRAKLSKRYVNVEIEAGYRDNIALLFKGQLRTTLSIKQGQDWITTLKAGDSEVAFRASRIANSYKKGTSIKDVLKDAAKGMQVGLGKALEKIDQQGLSGAITEFVTGTVITGSTQEELTKLLGSAGLKWNIVNGQMEIYKPGEGTEHEAVVLSPTSGLVGSPESGEDGRVKARSLLQPSLVPGRKVELRANAVKGLYVVVSAQHSGDTYGQDWYSDVELIPSAGVVADPFVFRTLA